MVKLVRVRSGEVVDKFEIKCGEEEALRRRRMKVVVNDGEFLVGICLEIEELKCERVYLVGFNGIEKEEVLKTESDVSGSLNNGLHNLSNVFIFVSKQMIAANGLLETCKSNGIGNKSLARSQIEGKTVNLETR